MKKNNCVAIIDHTGVIPALDMSLHRALVAASINIENLNEDIRSQLEEKVSLREAALAQLQTEVEELRVMLKEQLTRNQPQKRAGK